MQLVPRRQSGRWCRIDIMKNSFRCMLPHDRMMHVDPACVSESSVATVTAETLFKDERCIVFYDRMDDASADGNDNGNDNSIGTPRIVNIVEMPMCDIGEKFGFESITSLLFLHESDLRHVVFDTEYCSETLPEYITQDYVDSLLLSDFAPPSAVNDCLSVRYVGYIDGVDVGCGLFAEKNITKGDFLGEYLGMVLRSSTANESTAYSLSYPTSDGKLEINATEYGNEIRFANHSSEPNAAFIRVLLNGMIHVGCVSFNSFTLVLHKLNFRSKLDFLLFLFFVLTIMKPRYIIYAPFLLVCHQEYRCRGANHCKLRT